MQLDPRGQTLRTESGGGCNDEPWIQVGAEGKVGKDKYIKEEKCILIRVRKLLVYEEGWVLRVWQIQGYSESLDKDIIQIDVRTQD